MGKKYLIVFLLVAFALGFFSACNFFDEIDDPTKVKDDPIEVEDPIQKKIETMTLNEKIGQMVMVGIDGYANDINSQKMIVEYHVGGFILFKKNIQNSSQLLGLINSLKEANSINNIPLFFSVDEEGGRVSRIPKDFLPIPSSKEIAEKNSEDLSYQVGSIIGHELNLFGFNMNFGPVLDINSNPKNPVIGDRSFGADKDIVSRLGIQTMKGLHSQNVISVVKHFPGHGDTSVDSHIGLPTVDTDLERLRSFELVPFAEAIKNNVDAIMIAHILLPKIDPNNPASLSQIIITDLLRREMEFDGVIITDDMTMGAILENYDLGQATVRAINAGSDIILVCHEYEKEKEAIHAIKRAVENGDISIERIEKSVYRILKLKEKYAISDELSEFKDAKGLQNVIKDINKRIKELLS